MMQPGSRVQASGELPRFGMEEGARGHGERDAPAGSMQSIIREFRLAMVRDAKAAKTKTDTDLPFRLTKGFTTSDTGSATSLATGGLSVRSPRMTPNTSTREALSPSLKAAAISSRAGSSRARSRGGYGSSVQGSTPGSPLLPSRSESARSLTPPGSPWQQLRGTRGSMRRQQERRPQSSRSACGDPARCSAPVASALASPPSRTRRERGTAATPPRRQSLPSAATAAGTSSTGTAELRGAELGRPLKVLHVQVVAAHALRGKDLKGPLNPCVIARAGRMEHKTSVVENSCEPTWEKNNNFSFVVTHQHAGDELEFEVLNVQSSHRDTIGMTAMRIEDFPVDQRTRRRKALTSAEGDEVGDLDFEVLLKSTEDESCGSAGEPTPLQEVQGVLSARLFPPAPLEATQGVSPHSTSSGSNGVSRVPAANANHARSHGSPSRMVNVAGPAASAAAAAAAAVARVWAVRPDAGVQQAGGQRMPAPAALDKSHGTSEAS